MPVLESVAVQDFLRCAENGWRQGWHERNGGNMTYRLRTEELAQCKSALRANAPWHPLGIAAPSLGGEAFLTTGTGRYFQNILRDPADNIGIVQLDDEGGAWRLLWGLEAGGKPTSEFPTHVMNHAVRSGATGGASRVIYHAHPVGVIALSFILPINARAFTRALWQAMTE
ncbi:MAG: class II aldolase/adducin family protein, partial [Oscillospiraceae bacterium]|nr:class II aldolase/adducin family protein [Oscillospiraceae bacterium]